jgi:hypothetical protein|tara:strand:- start:1568 stop:1774 length:207 start_codon:yes stop_codon:yes gene_type:complete
MMVTTLTRSEIHLLRLALEYFIDSKKDEIEYDWVEGVHDDAISSCHAWIKDALELDVILQTMRNEVPI